MAVSVIDLLEKIDVRMKEQDVPAAAVSSSKFRPCLKKSTRLPMAWLPISGIIPVSA